MPGPDAARRAYQAFQAINPVESRLVASIGPITNTRVRSPSLLGPSILRLTVPNKGVTVKYRLHTAVAECVGFTVDEQRMTREIPSKYL